MTKILRVLLLLPLLMVYSLIALGYAASARINTERLQRLIGLVKGPIVTYEDWYFRHFPSRLNPHS